MSRGPGQIQVDDDKVAARPTGVGQGLIRTFSTDLPNNDFSQQIKTGKVIQDVADDLLRISGQEAAEKAANSVPIVKDENGNYVRPETPWMGVALRGKYNDIVDQRFINENYRDAEAQLNQIYADNFHDPQAAATLAAEAVKARMQAIQQPDLANKLGVILAREVNERQRGVLNFRARQDFQNTVDHAKQEEAIEFERAASAFEVEGPDSKRGLEHLQRARSAREMRADMGDIDKADLDLFDDEAGSVRAGSTVLTILNDLEKKGQLNPETFDQLRMMLRGAGSDNIAGLTKENIAENIPDPRMRAKLATRLNQIEQDYYQKRGRSGGGAGAATGALVTPENYQDAFTTRGGRPTTWSKADDFNYTRSYIEGRKLNPLAPEVIQHLYQVRGDVPELVTDQFENANEAGPERALALVKAYNSLDNLKTPDGRTVSKVGTLKTADAAFMHLVKQQYEWAQGKDERERMANALNTASKIYRAGQDTYAKAEDLTDFVVKRAGVESSREQSKTAFVREKVLEGIPNAERLDHRQKTALMAQVAGLIATSEMSFDKARKIAADRFIETHQKSDLVSTGGKPGGWIHKDLAIPAIDDVKNPGQVTDKWLAAYGDALFTVNADKSAPFNGILANPLIPREQLGRKIENPKVGENVFFVNTGQARGPGADKQFGMIYVTPDGNVVPLRDHQGSEVRLSTKLAHEKQAAKAAEGMLDLARSKPVVPDPGLSDGPDNPVFVRQPMPEGAAPARVDPFEVYNPMPRMPEKGLPSNDPDKPTRQKGAPTPPTPTPNRDDGLPSPFAPRPDQVRRSVSNYSAIESGKVTAPEVYEVLTMGRSGRTRMAVENQSGPRAGQRIEMHPELTRGLAAMIADMPEPIREQFRIGSTVRSYEEQSDIARDTMRKRGPQWRMWAAKPGHSRHETGQAADLQMGPAARRWVHRNAARYGLHFPMDHEHWHIEPINARTRRGVPMAQSEDGDSEDFEA